MRGGEGGRGTHPRLLFGPELRVVLEAVAVPLLVLDLLPLDHLAVEGELLAPEVGLGLAPRLLQPLDQAAVLRS
jgi:hypothetical protein